MPSIPSPAEIRFIPLILVFANVLGILLAYAATILLARNLEPSEFESYIGAIATLGLLVSLGEGGIGKYSLKIVPQYVLQREAGLLGGFLRFALGSAILLGILLAGIAAIIELAVQVEEREKVVLEALLYLPVMAVVGVAIDFLLAFRMPVFATLLARIVIPLTTLICIGLTIQAERLSPSTAVFAFGAGSLICLPIAIGANFTKSEPLTLDARPIFLAWPWFLNSLSFLVFSFLTAWIFRAPLVILHHIPHSGNELALLAPALETGCLVLLLAKSTDKYFQPMVSEYLSTNNWAEGRKMRWLRLQWISFGIAGFLGLIFFFGRTILGWYGDKYVVAYPALCVIAIGSSIWTICSLAPTYLQYTDALGRLLGSLLGHAILLTVLTVWLNRMFGTFGVAIAYAVSISSLSLCNTWLAHGRLREVRRA